MPEEASIDGFFFIIDGELIVLMEYWMQSKGLQRNPMDADKCCNNARSAADPPSLSKSCPAVSSRFSFREVPRYQSVEPLIAYALQPSKASSVFFRAAAFRHCSPPMAPPAGSRQERQDSTEPPVLFPLVGGTRGAPKTSSKRQQQVLACLFLRLGDNAFFALTAPAFFEPAHRLWQSL